MKTPQKTTFQFVQSKTTWPACACNLDSSVIDRLYTRFLTHAKWIAGRFRLPDHDWEDVIQDCLCSLMASNLKLQDEHHLIATFHLMLRHRVIDLRRMKLSLKRPNPDNAKSIEEITDAIPSSEDAQTKLIVKDLLATLTPEEWRLTYARFYDQDDLHVIAKSESTSITTVHRRLLRILVKLGGLDAR